MRKLFGLVAVAALALAGQAQAAPTPFTGSLAVQISSLPPIGVSAAGVGNYSGGGTFTLPANVFATVASVPVTDPSAFPIAGVKADVKNNAGSFVAGAGIMGLNGTANVCLFGACSGALANVNVPFTVNGTRGIGIGPDPIVVGGLVNVTVIGAPWTAGTATSMTSMGGTVTQMGYISGDSVRLVSPVVINTNIGASATLPAFAILELTFSPIPEPGTLMLLASGVAGLGILGRKRLMKS
ncbi:hypothetical protein BURK2_03343 [Burkholderiales bacterium]|jgi:hypothetical protein|nr:hypothetical protein BURK2_03343 [Burkholderiales bacterium]